jgi:hypothetical protein
MTTSIHEEEGWVWVGGWRGAERSRRRVKVGVLVLVESGK